MNVHHISTTQSADFFVTGSLSEPKSQASVVGLDSESAQRSPDVDPKLLRGSPRWEEVLFYHWFLG